ncbi:MAG TPA: type VII secretion integral membrane protein EccD [Pseudonocardiaceae bacterium]|nr:type VII secretion integral membrane protein EccD [Pseudonocardiaceae bacterium]
MVNSGMLAGLCRIKVRAPESTFELTIPTDVPFFDLVPTIVSYAGSDLSEQGLQHGGWILQRLGDDALDGEATADSLKLHDGDTLYLRPRRAELPPIHFDDLVDGVATALRSSTASWRPELSRWMMFGFVMALLVSSLTILVVTGSGLARTITVACVGLLLLAGAASAARAVDDAVVGAMLATASLPFVALAAALLPTGPDSDLLGARLLAGGAAAAGTAAIALAVVGSGAALFLSCGIVSAYVAIAGLFVVNGVPLGHAVAAVSVLVVILGVYVPAIGSRLGGLRLPPLPSNSEQLQEGIEPHDAKSVLARSAATQQYVTAMLSGLGILYAACLTGLLLGANWSSLTVLAVLGLLALLHGRSLGGVVHRLLVTMPGVYGILLVVTVLGWRATLDTRLLIVGGLVLLAAVIAVAAWTVPGRRMLPHWGHAANILHSLLAASLVPLVLQVFGVYGMLRGIF